MVSQMDPYKQNLTFHHADGTPFYVPLPKVDAFIMYAIRICINYGCQLGASIIILVILMLLTRPEKRKSAVFLLNTCALALNICRLVCQCVYFTGPWEELYNFVSEDFSTVPTSAYVNSVLGVVFTTLVLVFVEISLVLQVHIICTTLRRRYRLAVLWLSFVVAAVPIGLRFGYTVESSKAIIAAEFTYWLQWLESATNIATTVSICFFCAIFVTKLGFAIRQRKRLGVRDFGPMKVVFVMGCQTLFIPGSLLLCFSSSLRQ